VQQLAPKGAFICDIDPAALGLETVRSASDASAPHQGCHKRPIRSPVGGPKPITRAAKSHSGASADPVENAVTAGRQHAFDRAMGDVKNATPMVGFIPWTRATVG